MRKIDKKRTGRHMKALCKTRGIKPSAIQTELHLNSQQAIYRWFRGETLPSIEHLCLIAELLHLPIGALIVFQDDQQTPEQDIVFMLAWAAQEAKKSGCIREYFWKAVGILLGVLDDIQ